MSLIWFILAMLLCAFSPIVNEHRTPAQVDGEFTNLYDQAQPKQFRVVNSTPAFAEFKDGEVIVFSSNTVNKILWRSGEEIYAVIGSCITVRR